MSLAPSEGTCDRPTFVLLDEASTHLDSRTYRHEVASPLAKRFAKIGVDTAGLVGHTGKDVHPEVKRLATIAFYKHAKETAETNGRYDPDDAAPWAWNLGPQLLSKDFDWEDKLSTLLSRYSS